MGGVCLSCRHADQREEAAARAASKAVKAAKLPKLPPAAPDDPMMRRLDHMWFERGHVQAFIRERVGESARKELTKNDDLARAWDSWKNKPFIRFDKADEVLCALGLWTGDLGEPIYTGSSKRYPSLVAA